ncbi:hypothetical protein [Paraburkholderia flava]|nr:hypothetical protein [Paraburkholderia flava]
MQTKRLLSTLLTILALSLSTLAVSACGDMSSGGGSSSSGSTGGY